LPIHSVAKKLQIEKKGEALGPSLLFRRRRKKVSK
jgi:hypothetical protein